MANWRTTLGGAIGAVGTSLAGVGILTQLGQMSGSASLSEHQLSSMWYVALTGFVLSAIGRGVTALFAVDREEVEKIKKVMANGDTTKYLQKKPGEPPKEQDSTSEKTGPEEPQNGG
jgi:hypothetical protein